jgi:hypothetical protein
VFKNPGATVPKRFKDLKKYRLSSQNFLYSWTGILDHTKHGGWAQPINLGHKNLFVQVLKKWKHSNHFSRPCTWDQAPSRGRLLSRHKKFYVVMKTFDIEKFRINLNFCCSQDLAKVSRNLAVKTLDIFRDFVQLFCTYVSTQKFGFPSKIL